VPEEEEEEEEGEEEEEERRKKKKNILGMSVRLSVILSCPVFLHQALIQGEHKNTP
jgi:hypothetical protein